MIRMLVILAAGLYLFLQIGGQDHGQLRQGLAEAESEVTLPPAARVVAEQQRVRALKAEAVEVSFTPAAPLIVTPAPAAVLPEAKVIQASAEVGTVSVNEDDAAPIELADATDFKVVFVKGRSVNVRGGPSTQDAVVAKLTKGEAVTLVADNGTGWSQIRIEGDGVEGFISSQLLSEIQQ